MATSSNFWLNVPVPAPLAGSARERRYFRMMLRAIPAAAAVHATFVPLFLWLGSGPMAWFNVGTVVMYLLIALRFRRTANTWLLTPLLVEVCAHAVLASLAIGWDSAFHLYILSLGVASGAAPVQRDRVSLVLLCFAAWTGTLLVTRQHPPWTAVDADVLTSLAAMNFVGAFAVGGIFGGALTGAANRAERALADEHARSERLLHNILPPSVAERLKSAEGDAVIADGVDEASVLFSDLVGFTGLSQRVSPAQLVTLLNQVFSRFDDLAHDHGLEKIKTIGDAYMVASGLPQPRPDHAAALADFALAMVDVVAAVRAPDGTQLELRVGLHTGPVVAGVIGKRKFAYDLWGDTVNTAARMESHGAAGRVHVSGAFAEAVRSTHQVEARGQIPVKGKGDMTTAWLVRRRSDAGRAAAQGPPR